MPLSCLNYRNQEAIDKAIEAFNKESPQLTTLYGKGKNPCGNCLGAKSHLLSRYCYQPRLTVKAFGNSFGVYDNLKKEFAKSSEGIILTRDTIASTKRLSFGVQRTL